MPYRSDICPFIYTHLYRVAGYRMPEVAATSREHRLPSPQRGSWAGGEGGYLSAGSTPETWFWMGVAKESREHSATFAPSPLTPLPRWGEGDRTLFWVLPSRRLSSQYFVIVNSWTDGNPLLGRLRARAALLCLSARADRSTCFRLAGRLRGVHGECFSPIGGAKLHCKSGRALS